MWKIQRLQTIPNKTICPSNSQVVPHRRMGYTQALGNFSMPPPTSSTPPETCSWPRSCDWPRQKVGERDIAKEKGLLARLGFHEDAPLPPDIESLALFADDDATAQEPASGWWARMWRYQGPGL